MVEVSGVSPIVLGSHSMRPEVEFQTEFVNSSLRSGMYGKDDRTIYYQVFQPLQYIQKGIPIVNIGWPMQSQERITGDRVARAILPRLRPKP